MEKCKKCEVVSFIKVSNTRINIVCDRCGNIVAWSDSETINVEKVRPKITERERKTLSEYIGV